MNNESEENKMTKKMTKKTAEAIAKKFNDCTTWEELKEAYLEAITTNPNGIESIDLLFDVSAEVLKNVHLNHYTNQMYTKEPNEQPDEFKALIGQILAIENAVLEICGTWYYVTGIERTEKDKQAILKSAGFRFSGEKKAWFKAPSKKRYHGKPKYHSMNEIHEAFGRRVIASTEEL